ncbi:MAG: anhydro-N-acetylmuramic acid kinase [Candidatus Latescibacteria bacterium]|nr:anhydro-N-acetylmuramic acid kinase [Candidatus Latescibacterota bacterium]
MLSSLIDKKERRIVGLMSGTSADGIDAAIIELSQKEEEAVSVSLLAFDTISFPDGLREWFVKIVVKEVFRKTIFIPRFCKFIIKQIIVFPNTLQSLFIFIGIHFPLDPHFV